MDAKDAIEKLQKLDPPFGEVEASWRKIASEVPASEHARLVELLAADDLFLWLTIIGDLLPGLVDRADFPDIVRGLAEQCAGDMAAGPFLKSLRTAGMRTPEAVKAHVVTLTAMDTPPTRLAVGLLVAGVAVQDEGWAKAYARELIAHRQTSTALRILESLLIERIAHREAVALLFEISPHGREERVLYASCLRVSRDIEPERVDARFVDIAQGAGENELPGVMSEAAATLRRDPLGLDARKRLLELSFERGGAAAAAGSELFGSVYRDDPGSASELLTRIGRAHWLSTHLGMHAEASLYSQAAEIDRAHLADALTSWIDEGGKLGYQAPDGLLQLHEDHELELLDRIRGWPSGGSPRASARLKLLQDIISGRADPKVQERAIADAIELGRAQGVETPAVLEGEADPKWRALRMLQHMMFPVKDVDYEALFRNLELVPHVRDFMGKAWWESLRAKGAKDNLLPHLFHRTPATGDELEKAAAAFRAAEGDAKLGRGMQYNHLLHSVRSFEHWERVFSGLDPSLPGVGNLRRKLKNPPQVADALCEAEVTSALLERFPVTIEPDIPGLKSEPDVLVQILGQDVVLEIYNPKPPRELRYASGTHGLSLARIRGLVLDKYRRQFKDGAASFGLPVVIVVNANGSTLDDFEFEAVFHGSPAVTFTMDRETGAASESRLTRKEDHIGVEDPDTAVISGILGYRRNLTDLAVPTLTLDYYPNPAARRPLSSGQVDALCGALGTRPLRP